MTQSRILNDLADKVANALRDLVMRERDRNR